MIWDLSIRNGNEVVFDPGDVMEEVEESLEVARWKPMRFGGGDQKGNSDVVGTLVVVVNCLLLHVDVLG